MSLPGEAPQEPAPPSAAAATLSPPQPLGVAILLWAGVVLVLSIDLLVVRAPAAYLDSGSPGQVAPLRLAAAAAMLAGAVLPRLRPKPSPPIASSMGMLAALLSLSGFGWTLGFAHGSLLLVAQWGTAVLGGCLLGNTVGWMARSLGSNATGSLVGLLLTPWALGSLLLGTMGLGWLCQTLGLLRSGLLLGVGQSAVLLFWSDVERRLGTDRPSQSRNNLITAVALLALSPVGVCAAEYQVPLALAWQSPHPVVFSAKTDHGRFHVTAGQGSLHVFYNQRLRISTIDQRRWAESLVRPILARQSKVSHALVLSVGEGLIERELLADPTISTITSVVRDRAVGLSLSRVAEWRALTGASHDSPRVRFVTADPAAWLTKPDGALKDRKDAQLFDVIIVDLPDPSGPLESKYYTRHFYRALERHLADGGMVAIQSTSPRHSPRAFATIGATLQAAGFVTAPLRVPLITMGEWGVILGARDLVPEVVRPSLLEHTYPGTASEESQTLPADTRPPPGFVAQPSTLYNGLVGEWFCTEGPNGEC